MRRDSDIGAEVGRCVNRRVGSDFDAEVRSSDNEVLQLEVGDKVGYVDVISVDESVKCVNGGVSEEVVCSLCWGVGRGVCAGNVSADGITFGLIMNMILFLVMDSLVVLVSEKPG